MTASNRETPTSEADRTAPQTVSRYDVLLLVIPVTFLLAFVASQVSSFTVSTLLPAASLIGALAVADGLFVNPPHGPNSR